MRVTREFADVQGRKYIGLDGQSIKVPWRYNRVMCQVNGLTPIQELRVGQEVKAVIECKVWENEKYLILKEISTE
jgi:uncharacterized OB-fold protein